jgi:hypothetical protein
VNKLRSTDAFLICHNGPCAGDFFKQWEDVRLVTKSSGVCVSGSVLSVRMVNTQSTRGLRKRPNSIEAPTTYLLAVLSQNRL